MNTRTPTAAQLAAIESEHPQILCVAGPGAGKSHTLAERVRKLVERGSDPRKIAVVTYTNQAARNLEERIGPEAVRDVVGDVVEYQDMGLGFCGTLHGLGLRMLRKHGVGLGWGWGPLTAVIDDDAAADLLASKAKSMGCKMPLAKLIELKKAGDPKGRGRLEAHMLTVLAYYADLRESGLVDFDLILSEFLRLLQQPGTPIHGEFTDLLVDEVQDCNATDWAIFRAFPAARKFMVGDPRQAIFGFRGGAVSEMMRFGAETKTQVLHLAQNFRCGAAICEAANRLMPSVVSPTVSATGQTGDVDGTAPFETEGAEIAFVIEQIKTACAFDLSAAANQIAVLARTNAIADAFREGVKAAGLPVVEPPKSELPRDWALARALVELGAQPMNDTLALFFIIAQCELAGMPAKEARDEAGKRRIETQSKGWRLSAAIFHDLGTFDLREVSAFLDRHGITRETRALVAKLTRDLPPGATLADLALEMARFKAEEQEGTGEGVTCTTIHGAKGREWDVVFLVGFEDEVIPGNRKTDGPEEIEESRRLAFVGITRARHRVVFTSSKTRRANWGRQELQARTVSRFVGEALP